MGISSVLYPLYERRLTRATEIDMAEIRTCASCAGTFEIREIGGGMTSPEPESVKCPHCGHALTLLASGRLVARPLEAPPARDAPQG